MIKKRFYFIKTTVVICISLILAFQAFATDYYVDDDAGSGGDGSLENPFNRIMDGMNAAYAGDNVIVRVGTYNDTITTPRSGTSELNRVTLKAYDSETVTIDNPYYHTIDKAYLTIQDIIFKGQYALSDIIKVNSGGDNLKLIGCEVCECGNEGIDIRNVSDILIEDCDIHHCIRGSFTEQLDAHGIRGDDVTNLTIRNTDIYYVSGDCIQTSPDRKPWMNIVVEDCHLWTGPLPADAGEYNQGETPGENAYDTKQKSNNNRSTLYIRRCILNGWRNTPITNAAALNMKEKVDVEIDRCLFYDNEIGLRARGAGSGNGAWITMTNCIFYDHDKAVRYEDNIATDLEIYNCTFGADNLAFFQQVSSSNPVVKNCGFLGTKPSEASDASNLSLSSSDFVDVNNNDYHIASGSDAINAGTTISEVTEDYDGLSRPQGSEYDVGAYEYEITGPPPSAPSNLSATTVSSSQIDLSWTDNSTDETGFKIERSEDGESFSQIATNGANDTDYSDTGLSASTKYYYRVRAYNDNGNSAYSNVDSATTQGGGPVDDVADSDITVDGTVAGSYTDTQTSNDTYESIEEVESGGKPSSRYSYLGHKWTIDVTGASSVTFYVEAYHTSNSEGDDFVFAYSTNDEDYINMVTVTKTSDDDTYQSYSLPGSLSGTVYIRVMDTDQTGGNRNLDIIYIDHMYIRSGSAKHVIPVKTTELAIPNEVRLYSNYPNPFNPSTTIHYSLIQAEYAKLTIYDSIGRKVDVLVDKVQSEGEYTQVWEAVDSENRALPSGVYLCRLQAGTRVETIKMMYMR